MRYKVYENGNLVNTIIADSEFAALYASAHGYTMEEDPLEEDQTEPETEPTEADDTAAMLVDHEYRLTMLELGLTE